MLIITFCIKTYTSLNRKQRTKVGSSNNSCMNIFSGAPEGSILGPPLFNIFLCDVFLEFENNIFPNYADDTTPYAVGENTEEVMTELTKKLFKWFSDNQMKVNHGKCHLLLSSMEPLSI